jgi:hypothetical protein
MQTTQMRLRSHRQVHRASPGRWPGPFSAWDMPVALLLVPLRAYFRLSDVHTPLLQIPPLLARVPKHPVASYGR